MKLKFSIHYHTAWGESLHVCIDFHSQDGMVRHQNLLMQTEDGELWTLETSALMSRQHPLSHIQYRYQVEDADEQVLRKEWDMVPRTYYFDATKDYIFPDEWRDRPLPMHLYSAAYQTTQGRLASQKSKANSLEVLRLPLFRRTILFRVSAPQLKAGQLVAICGSHPAIGSWNTSRYLAMEYAGDGDWMLTVNAQGWLLPIEYKYVVVDSHTHELVAWEEGENRLVSIDSVDGNTNEIPDGQVLVLYGGHMRLAEETWRAAGVAIPVFSLRSEHSFGVGDFGDLRRFVDWAVATGMKFIQVLPVNDTTTDGRWHDSYPYNIVSMFALHPHYVDLEAAGTLRSKSQMTKFLRRRQELNALPYSDYEAVERVKTEYLQMLFEEQGRAVLDSKEFKDFVADNEDWLKPYARWQMKNDNEEMKEYHFSFVYFVQYLLHTQLKAAADYARSKGVVLKGDLPIGVNRDSVETRNYPELFNLDSQTGAPPDAFSHQGQNWGFPTYHWSEALLGKLRHRLSHMAQYFDALRIDHVLGFFRIWEIPHDAVYGLLGHFSPALPLTAEEIAWFGLPFRKELFTKPFINDRLIERLFGIHAQYVRDNFLVRKAYGLYDLQPEYNTQCKVAEAFAERRDESSLWIRDGLMRLISDVLFVEDPHQSDMYHPRIGVINEPIFEALSSEEKDAFMRLYNNYFYQRHSFFWGHQALNRLPAMLKDCRMLICAEDLGMLPDCVEPVLDQLRILTLEIQQMPKQQGFEFAHLDANPIRSVCTISTHDMAPLRQWWQEQPERRQRYYVTMLQKEGRAPEQLPAHLAEEIIARHLYCPSMLCILQLQDWLAMDGELRRKNPQDECINVPSDPYNRWQYRMHLTIEELLQATKYNNKVKTMIQRSRR
ncbi:MAG: 4-alpha-glucanotransferase [Prevotella sp.]|nr:4-alpha-glucanotransferase [Prevotella sp.]